MNETEKVLQYVQDEMGWPQACLAAQKAVPNGRAFLIRPTADRQRFVVLVSGGEIVADSEMPEDFGWRV